MTLLTARRLTRVQWSLKTGSLPMTAGSTGLSVNLCYPPLMCPVAIVWLFSLITGAHRVIIGGFLPQNSGDRGGGRGFQSGEPFPRSSAGLKEVPLHGRPSPRDTGRAAGESAPAAMSTREGNSGDGPPPQAAPGDHGMPRWPEACSTASATRRALRPSRPLTGPVLPAASRRVPARRSTRLRRELEDMPHGRGYPGMPECLR